MFANFAMLAVISQTAANFHKSKYLFINTQQNFNS